MKPGCMQIPFTNERGSIINMALLILIVLSMLMIFLSNTTTTDVKIAANNKYYASAFNNADSGVIAAGATIKMVKDEGERPTIPTDLPTPVTPDVPGFTVLDPQIDLELMEPYADVLDKIVNDGGAVDVINDPTAGGGELDIRVAMNDISSDVAVWRELGSTKEPPGNSNEFATGAGNEGSIKAILEVNIMSVGVGPKSASSSINAKYDYLQK